MIQCPGIGFTEERRIRRLVWRYDIRNAQVSLWNLTDFW